MRKLNSYLFLVSLFLIMSGCGGSDPDEEDNPLPESCFLTSYVNESNVNINYIYNQKDLVTELRYEISGFSGTVQLSYDDQDRLIRLTSESSDITLSYTSSTIEVEHEYLNDERSGSGLILGSGPATFNLNDKSQVTTIFKEGQQNVRIEYNESDQLQRLLLGPVGSERVYAEVTDYDNNPDPFENLPIGFFIGEDDNRMRQLFWHFAPWEAGKNNPKRIVINEGASINTFTYQYNESGYPVSSAGSAVQTYEYSCK